MSKLIFDSFFLNKKKPNFIHLLRKQSHPIRKFQANNSKKIRSSSTDNIDNNETSFSFSINSPLNNNNTFYPLNKLSEIKAYSNKNGHINNYLKLFMRKNKKYDSIKKINNILDNSIEIYNKNSNYSGNDLMQKLVIYLVAFDDYIKLLEIKEEHDLLLKIKQGIEDIVRKMNFKYSKLKTEKTDFSNDMKIKINKLNITNHKLKSKFIKKTDLNTQNNLYNGNFYLRKFNHEKNSSTSNEQSRNNKKNISAEENLSDLQSVRFSDKIIMKRTKSTKIPKLDLSFFSLYQNYMLKKK
jgi:hypothetical protein